MEFDPYLYVAFGAGLLVGWALHPRSPWVGRATLASVAVLLALFGASLNGVPPLRLLTTIPQALGLVALVLAVTALAVLALQRASAPDAGAVRTGSPRHDRWPLTPLLLAALIGGYAVGHWFVVPTQAAIPWALYALLALVALDLRLTRRGLRRLWLPVGAAVVGASAGALALALVGGVSLPVAFATTWAFGWYSLAGPLVSARAGAVLGLLAFLTNFLREDLTMFFAPAVGRRLRAEGIVAFGGATSMDTTLLFATRYGDAEGGSLALATGLIFTVSASILLPLLLSLP